MPRRLLFRLLAAAPAPDHIADAELLRRFVASNDSAAFELIVRRHADAVWATCRRVLNCDADAEDAFQATFLALIRKAKTIRTPCAGGWLHRVAMNAALKARERAARTFPVEPSHLDAIQDAAEPPDAELARAVHEELALLSERERLPVVLCDLEGLSHADAAQALGWPIGTVSGRLSRARAKLRERLERRGLKPSAALLPALGAPPHLIPNALSLTAGAASPVVVVLSEGALAMVKTTHWTWAAIAVVCAGLVGAGAAVGLTQPDAKQVAQPTDPAPVPPQPAKEKPANEEWLPPLKVSNEILPPTVFPGLVLPELDPNDPKGLEKRAEAFVKLCPRLNGTIVAKIDPTDDTLRKLLKARLHQGTLEVQRVQRALEVVGPLAQDFAETHECLLDMQTAATELWTKQPKELVPWLEELLVMAKELERYTQFRVKAGATRPKELNTASRHRLKLEAELWKAKGLK